MYMLHIYFYMHSSIFKTISLPPPTFNKDIALYFLCLVTDTYLNFCTYGHLYYIYILSGILLGLLWFWHSTVIVHACIICSFYLFVLIYFEFLVLFAIFVLDMFILLAYLLSTSTLSMLWWSVVSGKFCFCFSYVNSKPYCCVTYSS